VQVAVTVTHKTTAPSHLSILHEPSRASLALPMWTCHKPGNSNITKVNRISTKRAEMLLGKGSLVVPHFSPL
jgi:hypothetical protein